MRPWKIGTPISTHLPITSCCSIRSWSASSRGVRWLAIKTSEVEERRVVLYPPGGRVNSALAGCCGVAGDRRIAIMGVDVRSRRQRRFRAAAASGSILSSLLGLIALGYALVNIATQKPDKNTVHIEGIGEAQELFGGVPQEGARLGSEDAPVTIQVFDDVQCSICREAFLDTIPALTENYARPGDVKFLYRHYSNTENEIEDGFYGAEAAAEQGYGWQYAYLFFLNQDEAERFGDRPRTSSSRSPAGSRN